MLENETFQRVRLEEANERMHKEMVQMQKDFITQTQCPDARPGFKFVAKPFLDTLLDA